MVEETKTTTKTAVEVEIEVNKVRFRDKNEERTGLQIKQDAIDAGVKIKLSYVLDLEREHGSVRIPDDRVVELEEGMKFLAHPGGSDS